MRITQWGEFGVLCSSYIAYRQREGSTTVGAAEVAQSQGIALQYAQQILHRLRRKDIIESVRGPQGGYRLARSPDKILLKEIIAASEGSTFDTMCETKSLKQDRCISGTCGLKTIWQELQEHINNFLLQYSLADILNRQNGSVRADFVGQVSSITTEQK